MERRITEEYIIDYLRGLLPKREGRLAQMEDYARENYIPIVQPEVAQLLRVLTAAIGARRVLELGCAIGYSALVFAQELPEDGEVVSIERSDTMIEMAKENIQAMNLEHKIKIVKGDVLQVIRTMDESFDLIFMDAAKSHYSEFFPHCLRMLCKGGLLVCDNILYMGMVASEELETKKMRTIVRNMREYLKSISTDERVSTSILPVGDGVAICFKR